MMRWKKRVDDKLVRLESGDGWLIDKVGSLEKSVRKMEPILKQAACDHTNRKFLCGPFSGYTFYGSYGVEWCSDCEKVLRYFATERDFLAAQKAAYEENVALLNAEIDRLDKKA
jgi:hypothetical protein